MRTINDYAELVKEKHALNETIAPVEADETDASKAYAVGEQLILSGILYDVIAPISQHDVITTTGSGANIAPAGPIGAKIQTLTNKLNDEVETRATLGAHNLLPFDLDKSKAINTPGTWSDNVYSLNGITFTVDTNGTISANGTASANTSFNITREFSAKVGKSYTLNGGLNDDSASTQRIWVTSNTAFPLNHRLTSYDLGPEANSTQDALANESDITVYIQIFSGVTLSNAVFKPMIRLTSDLNSEFAPYAMTNRELMEVVQQINNGYIFQGVKNVKVTTDGVKTYKELLNELSLAFKTYAETNSDKYYTLKCLKDGTAVMPLDGGVVMHNIYHGNGPGTMFFVRTSVESSAISYRYYKLAQSLSDNQYYTADSTWTLIDNKDNVPSSGIDIILYMDEYIKVS